MPSAIFLPQNHEVDARSLHLARQGRPVRLCPPTLAWPGIHLRKQPLFENGVRHVRRQRPAETGLLRPFEIILDGTARHTERAPDPPFARTVVM
jgi:hypothetical protein